ncbi:MAG: tetratricopeptide repeat protein [Nitrospiraceae bacterium]|nr:tetratricopeptide repeat protein [Nitrospiraceae bacterium]
MADKTTIMKDAQKYVLKGQIDKAIAEWEKLLREGPDGNTYNIVGDLYLKKGDKKGAVDYLHKSAGFFRQEGFSLKALALYKKVLNINSSDTGALNALGQLSEEKGLITDAIKYYLATADCLSKEGRKDELLDIYYKILQLSPTNVPLKVKVAEILLKEGLVSHAAGEYCAVARLYEEQEDYQKAQEFYERTLSLQPSHKDAALGLVDLLDTSGDLEGALSHINGLAARFDDDGQILLRHAELNIQAGRNTEAEESLVRLKNADPANIRVRQMLGDIYLRTNQEEKAWQEFLPVIEKAVADEHYDKAIELLERFRRLDPLEIGRRLTGLFTRVRDDDRLVAELIGLGEIYEQQGLDEEARNCYRDAAEIRPYDEDLQKKLREKTAEPEPVAVPGPEPGEKAAITIISGSEKTAEEIFVETDIFSRYGLVHEAVKLLEGLKVREPKNIDVHLRLKSLYSESSDKEAAVTECIILHELYTMKGDLEAAGKELRDAVEISPEDPRLLGRVESPPAFEPTSYVVSEPVSGGGEASDIEDYEDALAEADFYVRQGLIQEASKILEKMQLLFPDNKDIAERLESIGLIAEPLATLSSEVVTEAGEEVAGADVHVSPEFELEPTGYAPDRGEVAPGFAEVEFGVTAPVDAAPAEPEAVYPEEVVEADLSGAAGPDRSEQTAFGEPLSTDVPAGAAPYEAAPPAAEEPAEEPAEEYENLMLTEQDLVEAEEMPDLALDNDVLEIFQEFKKGLEKELGEEDSETHYNLGIAYKEMGLVDDAIKEFQTSRNDPKRFIQSSTMLGVCYMEKGLYSLAVDVLRKVAETLTEKDDSYWPVRYDLAEACEKNRNFNEALDLYTSVYGWNARFRGVSDKVSQVRAQIAQGGPPQPPKTAAEKPKDKRDRVSYL